MKEEQRCKGDSIFDQTRCIGCFTCCVACKDWHDIPAGSAHWRRVIPLEEGEFSQLFLAFLSTAYITARTPCVLLFVPQKQ